MPDPLNKSSTKCPAMPMAHTANALRQISGSDGCLRGFDSIMSSYKPAERCRQSRPPARQRREANEKQCDEPHESVGAAEVTRIIQIGSDAAYNQHRRRKSRQSLRPGRAIANDIMACVIGSSAAILPELDRRANRSAGRNHEGKRVRHDAEFQRQRADRLRHPLARKALFCHPARRLLPSISKPRCPSHVSQRCPSTARACTRDSPDGFAREFVRNSNESSNRLAPVVILNGPP